MSAPDGRRELLDAPDGTSTPLPVRSPLVPIGNALESLHRKADFLIQLGAFIAAAIIFAALFAIFRPDGTWGSIACGAAGGLAWYLIERRAHKI